MAYNPNLRRTKNGGYYDISKSKRRPQYANSDEWNDADEEDDDIDKQQHQIEENKKEADGKNKEDERRFIQGQIDYFKERIASARDEDSRIGYKRHLKNWETKLKKLGG